MILIDRPCVRRAVASPLFHTAARWLFRAKTWISGRTVNTPLRSDDGAAPRPRMAELTHPTALPRLAALVTDLRPGITAAKLQLRPRCYRELRPRCYRELRPRYHRVW
jgi:hypothetical protein